MLGGPNKRASEGEDGGSAAKKSNSAAGGIAKGGAGPDQKVNPIPRHLALQSWTLHFVQRTWEEIGPGQLYYLPLSITPRGIFDNAMKNQFKKFVPIMHNFEINSVGAKISNIIMLQDDLQAAGGQTLESTAFTQACYLMHIIPKRMTEYFKLGTRSCGATYDKIMNVDYAPTCNADNTTQLLTMQDFTDFEKMTVYPAKINITAGWEGKTAHYVTEGENKYSISDDYISPMDGSTLANFSGNMQGPTPVLTDDKSITWMRNLDEIKFYKYGDSFHLPIQTNIGGNKLLKHTMNDIFQQSQTIAFHDGGNVPYHTMFAWPGNNRPTFDRGDNFQFLDPVGKNKSYGHIKHNFLCMPPIKKPTGALIKQRASFVLEQHMTVTFHSNESIFNMEDGENPEYFLNQKGLVITRPMVFGAVKDINAVNVCGPSQGTIEQNKNVWEIIKETQWLENQKCQALGKDCTPEDEHVNFEPKPANTVKKVTFATTQDRIRLDVSAATLFFSTIYAESDDTWLSCDVFIGPLNNREMSLTNKLITCKTVRESVAKLGYVCPIKAPVGADPVSNVFFV